MLHHFEYITSESKDIPKYNLDMFEQNEYLKYL